MTRKYQLALHIFRRDLRLQDNTALIAALKQAEQVIPCFIFDKRQLERNEYRSDHCVQFMVRSLQELDAQLQQKNGRLYYFSGIAEEVVQQLLTTLPIDAVFVNRDYTPFSINRDLRIEKVCQAKEISFYSYADALLNEPELVLKNDGKPYTVFTPYLRRALLVHPEAPHKNTYSNYYQQPIEMTDQVFLQKLQKNHNPNLFVKGGREEALDLLKKITTFTDYADKRNYPALNATSKLSAHNKFGTLSIREFQHTILKYLNKQHTLINELHWRDFFTQIAFQFPRVFGQSFHEKYDSIEWSNNLVNFERWQEGQTGFPIVDAGMRELNTTGYMHNRVRMITASFLTKDLHIDWRWGEKYFAQKLVDYDPAVNNGNWQWAASTGCDAQPYFRIFNPWLQQEKFDADCLYIKKWIPELASLPAKTIHQLYKNNTRLMTSYPFPMVDHQVESQKAKVMYKFAGS